MNSKFVVSELYLKPTLSTNLPHRECALWNNHRMWMPRECQCNQDKLVKELRKLLDSTHPGWMKTTWTFALLSCTTGGPLTPACSCSAARCQ